MDHLISDSESRYLGFWSKTTILLQINIFLKNTSGLLQNQHLTMGHNITLWPKLHIRVLSEWMNSLIHTLERDNSIHHQTEMVHMRLSSISVWRHAKLHNQMAQILIAHFPITLLPPSQPAPITSWRVAWGGRKWSSSTDYSALLEGIWLQHDSPSLGHPRRTVVKENPPSGQNFKQCT